MALKRQEVLVDRKQLEEVEHGRPLWMSRSGISKERKRPSVEGQELCSNTCRDIQAL